MCSTFTLFVLPLVFLFGLENSYSLKKKKTYSLKRSFNLVYLSPMILIFKKKKTVSEPRGILRGTYFRKRKIQQNCNFTILFVSASNKMAGKIIQSFVVHNSNLVQKMFPRRLLSIILTRRLFYHTHYSL